MSPSDEQLMAEVQRGSRDSFASLYRRYSSRVYRVVRSVCRDPDEVEEAHQEAFVALWRRRATFRRGRGSVAGWLVTIAHHSAVDVARHHDRDAELDRLDEVARVPGPLDLPAEAEARSREERLRRGLAHLPAPQRQVILLAFYRGLTHAQIANRLSLPEGTVKGRLRLGLQRLRTEAELGGAGAHAGPARRSG